MKNSIKTAMLIVLLGIVMFGGVFVGILHFREQMVIDSAAQTAKLERNLSGRH